ncbi:MAG: hypothetical protein J3Q66DRAFT_98244 [Benniella sp.]|nr:MAG: hypothetical protein J3Q66DRAFT_98244 [Benniella sp.]
MHGGHKSMAGPLVLRTFILKIAVCLANIHAYKVRHPARLLFRQWSLSCRVRLLMSSIAMFPRRTRGMEERRSRTLLLQPHMTFFFFFHPLCPFFTRSLYSMIVNSNHGTIESNRIESNPPFLDRISLRLSSMLTKGECKLFSCELSNCESCIRSSFQQ